ncbi:MAG: fibronectin type III domain-containing protein, partial [Desulfatiglandaceae bacterium]
MRKRVFFVVISAILFLFPSFLWAGTVTIHWQANTEKDLKEYRVYHGTASRIYSTPVPGGKATSYTFNNLTEGITHYFAVTAVDTSDNESGFSAEVTKFIPVSGSDTQAPQVTITSPTTSGNYTTSSSSINLGGGASDNVGVTRVTW